MCIIVIYAIVRHRVSCKFHIHNSMSSCMRLDYVAVWQFIFAIRLWQGLIYIVGILCPPGAIDHSRTYVGIKIYVGGNEVCLQSYSCSRDSSDNRHLSTAMFPLGSVDLISFQAIQGIAKHHWKLLFF